MKTPLTRRQVLRGALGGSIAVALPLPRLGAWLNDSGTAFADGAALPKRYGTWFFGNGVIPSRWVPDREGVGDQWSLSEQLRPLSAFKRRLSVATGYDLDLPFELAHLRGAAAVLTGLDKQETTVRAPSIDQLLADRLGSGAAFRSLEVAVSEALSFAGTICRTVSHSGRNAPNYPEGDPNRLFARLFGIAPASEEMRTLEASVLDAVLDDLSALRRRVGVEDRARLEAHADGVRAMERRLQAMPSICAAPDAPNVRHPGITSDEREEAPPELNRVMAELTVTALACDLTRVFSFMLTPPAAQVHYRHLGADYDASFHDNIVHVAGPDDDLGLVTGGVLYAMSCFAEMLELMESTPDGDGTLLDRTVIFATSCIGRGWDHDFFDHPLLFAGGQALGHRGDVHHRSATREPATRGMLTAAEMLGVDLGPVGEGTTYADRGISELLRA
ncbi:MAG: DUF1552 domain-containing protein [Myxococcales bacterium]|nr:DUF1552 domain-containing protein [Myxococcales bacterium]MCB9532371.1 DUF1552 domain-containing protein [Myxococcales bacterium]